MTTQTTTPAAAPLALDITYGPRPATRCILCDRAMPAADRPVFELETTDGDPLCDVCANRQHHALRLVTALLTAIVEAYATGNKKAADEAVRGIASGIELLQETATPVPYRRPVRHQPTRGPRRSRRR